jgi:hypothetical protein
MKKERLRKAVKRVMEGRATAAVVPDAVRGEIFAAQRPDLAANRLAKLCSALKTRKLHRTHKSQRVPYSHATGLTKLCISM